MERGIKAFRRSDEYTFNWSDFFFFFPIFFVHKQFELQLKPTMDNHM